METTLLKTGRVAEILGVSRQHVVDLCDRGDLPSIRIGAHRRVRQSDLEELLAARTLTREEHKLLWLHQAMLGHLLTRPDEVLQTARGNIHRWLPQHREDGMTAAYLRDWERLLDSGVDAVRTILCSTTPRACELRQNSPFAGVLSPAERIAALQAFRASHPEVA